jgi:hypothetical protein
MAFKKKDSMESMIPMPRSALQPKAFKLHYEMANKLVQPCGTRHWNAVLRRLTGFYHLV